MTGVQLIGKDAVLRRFEKFDTDTWALFQGKQFIVSGVGPDALADWLEDFSASGSTATYMLRVYDSDIAPSSATAATGYIACMNFKLVDMYEGAGIAGHTTRLMQRIEGIEKRLDTESDDTDDNDRESINDVLIGWLSNPEKLGLVIGAARQIMGMPPVPGAAAALPQAISGFNVTSDSSNQGADTDEKLGRLAAALDSLEKSDTNLVGHLEKLAALAKSDPLIFTGVISKLDAL